MGVHEAGKDEEAAGIDAGGRRSVRSADARHASAVDVEARVKLPLGRHHRCTDHRQVDRRVGHGVITPLSCHRRP